MWQLSKRNVLLETEDEAHPTGHRVISSAVFFSLLRSSLLLLLFLFVFFSTRKHAAEATQRGGEGGGGRRKALERWQLWTRFRSARRLIVEVMVTRRLMKADRRDSKLFSSHWILSVYRFTDMRYLLPFHPWYWFSRTSCFRAFYLNRNRFKLYFYIYSCSSRRNQFERYIYISYCYAISMEKRKKFDIHSRRYRERSKKASYYAASRYTCNFLVIFSAFRVSKHQTFQKHYLQ